MDLCERSTWRTRARVSRRWWEQSGIDLECAKKRVVAAESEMDSDSESGSESGRERSRGGESSEASGSSGADRSRLEG